MYIDTCHFVDFTPGIYIVFYKTSLSNKTHTNTVNKIHDRYTKHMQKKTSQNNKVKTSKKLTHI